MIIKRFSLVVTFILFGLVACTTSAPEAEETSEAESPTNAAQTSMDPDLPEGVSLSEDGQILMMDEFSMLEAYCMGGDGKLAISYVGEAGSDNQLVSCGPTFEEFDAARENSFADVNVVSPAIADSVLQLQAGEYTRVKCLSNQTSLEQAASEPSDGHMVLNCL